jgi:C-terminal processing protease CtpA/Prc
VIFDPAFAGLGIKIIEVLTEGPLAKAGMNLRAGNIIEAIDGEQLRPDMDYAPLLNRKAGKNVLITVFDPSANSRREVVVKPISLGEESG